jgi:hypothetical protein
MFGGLLIALFGGIGIKTWAKDEQAEQTSRNNARKYNNKAYVDKWGNWRHTESGKKYTTEDWKNEYHEFCDRQDAQREKWENKFDALENDLYRTHYDTYIKGNYPLTYEEWIVASEKVGSRYYEKYKSKFSESKRTELRRYWATKKR